MNEVITHGGVDRRYKLCKCSVCGVVDTCIPTTDFYTKSKDPTGVLTCSKCMPTNITAVILRPSNV